MEAQRASTAEPRGSTTDGLHDGFGPVVSGAGWRGRKGDCFFVKPWAWLSSSKRRTAVGEESVGHVSSHDYMFGTCTHQPRHPETESRGPSPCSPSSLTLNPHFQSASRDQVQHHYVTEHSRNHQHYYYRRRPLSFPLSSSQYHLDRAWWRDTATLASCTTTDAPIATSARLPRFETIPEPEIAYYNPLTRMVNTEAGGEESGRAVLNRANGVERRRSEGSGSASDSVLYDWTRPGFVDGNGHAIGRQKGRTTAIGGRGAGGGGGKEYKSAETTMRDGQTKGCNPFVCDTEPETFEGIQRTD